MYDGKICCTHECNAVILLRTNAIDIYKKVMINYKMNKT